MSLTTLASTIILPVLGLAIVLVVARLTRGPHIADRVVALDLLATLGIGVVVTYAIATDQPLFLDASTVLALISFLGTVAFAFYLQRRSDGEENES